MPSTALRKQMYLTSHRLKFQLHKSFIVVNVSIINLSELITIVIIVSRIETLYYIIVFKTNRVRKLLFVDHFFSDNYSLDVLFNSNSVL